VAGGAGSTKDLGGALAGVEIFLGLGALSRNRAHRKQQCRHPKRPAPHSKSPRAAIASGMTKAADSTFVRAIFAAIHSDDQIQKPHQIHILASVLSAPAFASEHDLHFKDHAWCG
jgi:hypothetical protein